MLLVALYLRYPGTAGRRNVRAQEMSAWECARYEDDIPVRQSPSTSTWLAILLCHRPLIPGALQEYVHNSSSNFMQAIRT